MSDAPKSRPRAFRLDERAPGDARDFVLEERPDAFEAETALLIGDTAERATEEAQARGFLRRAAFSWGGLLLSSLGGLIAFSFGLWLDQLVESLFARSPALGVLGLVLAGLALLALVALSGREILAIFRQRKIALLHKALALAHETDDRELARAKVGELVALYEDRPAVAASRAHLSALRGEIVDGRDLIDIAERQLMPALDSAARQEIASAAKRVSLVAAISPRAAIDMIFVAAQALRLIRRIAEIYGGRPGMFGAWRLARAVGSHLAITGGMALTDGLGAADHRPWPRGENLGPARRRRAERNADGANRPLGRVGVPADAVFCGEAAGPARGRALPVQQFAEKRRAGRSALTVGRLDHDAVELFGEADLAGQAGVRTRIHREIQHVRFHRACRRQLVEPFRRDIDMAGGAGAGAAAFAQNLVDADLDGRLHHRHSRLGFRLAPFAGGADIDDLDHCACPEPGAAAPHNAPF